MEKQIEEMAKVMCGNDCEECAKETASWRGCSLEKAREEECLIKEEARKLYEQGYRKIEDYQVVVTKEAWEKANKTCNPKAIRKETAKEILESFYKQFVAYTLGGDYYTDTEINETIQYLEERYGVEIEL